jgi:hypothetical protein
MPDAIDAAIEETFGPSKGKPTESADPAFDSAMEEVFGGGKAPTATATVAPVDASQLGINGDSAPGVQLVAPVDETQIGLNGEAPPTMPAPPVQAPSADFPMVVPRQATPAELEGEVDYKSTLDFAAYRAAHSDVTAEKLQQIMQMKAARPDLSPQFIADNMALVRQNVDQASIKEALSRSPRLVQHLRDATTPVVKDEIADASKLEWWVTGKWEMAPGLLGIPQLQLKTAPAGPRAAWNSVLEQEYMARTGAQASGFSSPENDARIAELEARGTRDFGDKTWLQGSMVKASGMAPYLAESMVARGAGAVIGASATGPGGVAAGQYAGGFAVDYFQNLGPQFRMLKKLVAEDGKPLLSDDEARVMATGASVVNAGLGAVLGKVLTGAASRVLGINVMTEALAQKTVQSAFKNAIREGGTTQAVGTLLMASQVAVNQGTAYLARSSRGQDVDAYEEIVKPTVESVKESVQALGPLSAMAAGRALHAGIGAAHMSSVDVASFDRAVAQAEKSKMRTSAPDQFEEMVGTMSQGAKVFVNAEVFVERATKAGLDPAELATRIMGDGASFAEALRTKGDLAIPKEQYLARVVGTDVHTALKDDVRMRQEGLSNRQLGELDAKAKEYAALPPDKMEAQQRAVYDHFYSQAAEGGKRSHNESDASAKLTAATFRGWADKYNENAAKLGEPLTDAWQMYERLGKPRIGTSLEEMAKGEARMAQADLTRPEAVRNIELHVAKEKDLAARHEAAKREYFLDRNTQTYAAHVGEHLARDPKRPILYLAHIINTKDLNDTHGHETADAGIRALAQSAREAGIPDPVKNGGDIAFYGDETHGDAVQAIAQRKVGDQYKVRIEQAPVDVAKKWATPEGTGNLDAAYKESRAQSEKNRADGGEDTHRKSWPKSADKDAPKVDWDNRSAEAKNAHLTPEEKVAKFGLNEKDPAVLAYREKAKALTAPTAELLAKVPRETIVKDLSPEIHAIGDKMGTRALAEATYFDDSGILSHKGFDVQPERAVKASIDLRLVKLVDDAKEGFGKIRCDRFVGLFGRVVAEHDGLKAYFAHANMGGDEFMAAFHNELAATTYLGDLREVLNESTVYAADRDVVGPNGEKQLRLRVKKGIEFAYGLGDTFEKADKDALPKNKANDPAPRPIETLWGKEAEDALRKLEADDLATDLNEPQPSRDLVRTSLSALEGAPGEVGANRSGPGVEARGAGLRGVEGQVPPGSEVASLPEGGQVTLKQKDKGPGDRGSFTFRFGPEGKSRDFQLAILNGDKSTLAHETFHWLSMVIGDLAQDANAPESIKADYAKLIGWMGHADHADRTASFKERIALEAKEARTPAEEARVRELAAKEERASYGWEQYLSEGKAPSAELAGVFRRFANWMVRIYKGIKGEGVDAEYRARYGHGIELSDEVRGIFDRLLASDEEIKKAQVATEALPFPAMGKLTPEEQTEYDASLADATEKGRRDLLRRLASQDKGYVAEERDRVRGEVESELASDPTYSALDHLQNSSIPGLEGQRLDRAALVKEYGADFVRTLPRGIFETEKGKPGMGADETAAHLGFESGDAMVRAMSAAEPRKELVEKETQARLEKLYGPTLLNDPQKLAALAMDSVHTDDGARHIVLEVQAMARQLDPKKGRMEPLEPRLVKELARRIVEGKKIGELLPNSYLVAESATARKAIELAGAGKFEEARDQKEAQLLNRYLYRAARDIRDEMESAKEFLSKRTTDSYRGDLGKASPDLLAAHDAILGAIGLTDRTQNVNQTLQALNALERFVENDAGELAFDVDAVRDLLAEPSAWRDLNPDEARNLLNAVKNIRQTAKDVNEIEVEGQRMELAEVIAQISKDAERLPDHGLPAADRVLESAGHRAGAAVQSLDAALLDPERLLGMLGPTAKRVIVDGYIKARNYKDELNGKTLKFYEKWEQLPKEMRARRYDIIAGLEKGLPIETMSGPRSRQWLWMVALNMGNQSNRDRLLGGYNWNEGEVLKVMGKHLTKEECDFLQSVWTHNDKDLWPLVAAKEARKTGLPPEKIKATPFELQLADGTTAKLEGGYFPAKYDPRPGVSKNDLGGRQAEANIASLYGSSYVRQGTQKSHTKKRADVYSDAVNLEWGTVPSHLAQVLHDLAFDEYVRQTGRLFFNPDMQRLMARRLGEERAIQPKEWLKYVANSSADSVPASVAGVMNILGGLRNRAVVGAIGHSMSVAAGDITNAAVAMFGGLTKAKYAVPSFIETLVPFHYGAVREQAMALSYELPHRQDSSSMKLQEALRDIGKAGRQSVAGGALEAARATSWIFMDHMDRLCSTQIWLARYRQGLADGLTAGKDGEASRTADAAVRAALPGHDIAEQSALMRDKRGVGALLLFHGYFNKLYNIERGLGHEAATAVRNRDPGAALKVAENVGRALAVLAVANVAGDYISGRGKEDDETYGEWVGRKMLAAPAGLLPFGAAIGEPLADKLVTGKVRKLSVRAAPALGVIQQVMETIGRAADEGRPGDKRVWDAIQLALLALKLPANQPRKTGEYLTDLALGDKSPKDPVDLLGSVVYGSRDRQPANPARDLSEALQR